MHSKKNIYIYINTTYITCPGCTSNLNLFPARWHDAKFGINDQSVCDDNVQGVLQRDIESILPCLSVSVCVRIRFNIHAIEWSLHESSLIYNLRGLIYRHTQISFAGTPVACPIPSRSTFPPAMHALWDGFTANAARDITSTYGEEISRTKNECPFA